MQATMEKTPLSLMQNGNPHQTCIDSCVKCAQICQECLNLCLNEADVKARANCIKTLQDCAEICSTTACFMSRGSGSIMEMCEVCAVICDKCATECGIFEDQHCQSCSATCRQCADECRNMANM